MEELELIKSIAKGNKPAYRKLYDSYSLKVYNTALSYCQKIEDAEEVTQDVFTKIFLNASTFKGNSSLNTWIYRITVNTSLNLLKKKKRSSNIFSLFGNEKMDNLTFEHPGIILENKEKGAQLFKAIQTLPESQKTAFILSHIEELPQKEVADIMNTSLKAVESLLQRAKGNLRKKLTNLSSKRRKK